MEKGEKEGGREKEGRKKNPEREVKRAKTRMTESWKLKCFHQVYMSFKLGSILLTS